MTQPFGATIPVTRVPQAGSADAVSGGGLTVNTTFYVATNGDDSANDGLTADTPFATLQKAIDTIGSYGFISRGVTVTVQIADGTYLLTSSINLAPFSGGGAVLIKGNTASPTSVIFTAASAITQFFLSTFRSNYTLEGFRLTATSGTPSGIFASGGYIAFRLINFHTGLSQHIRASFDGFINGTGNYTITGGGTIHMSATNNGTILIPGSATVTLTGTPAFSGAFANCLGVSFITCFGTTYSGSATGPRYVVGLNGVISTNGGGANFFPGNSAGSAATGGQYA